MPLSLQRVFFIFSLILICAAHTSIAAAQEDKPKRLVIGISQYPSTFHPGIDSMMAKSYVHGFTRRPITVYNAEWQKVCMLCTELPTYKNSRAKVETREDGTKGIAATYTIRKDAKWSDGTPITTKDILFTWKTGKDPLVGISNYELYSKDIVNITASDAHNFTIHYEKVTCDFNELADFDVLPAHAEEAIYNASPKDYKTKTLYDTDTAHAALYNGPYRIQSAQTGQEIVLTRNPHWWGDRPFFDEIVLKSIENTNALSAQLLSGQIDMISGELGLPMDQARSLEKRLSRKNDTSFTFIYKPGLIYEHIDLNLTSPFFKDKRVRQALLYGIDRESISQQLFDGKQPVAHHNVNPLDSVYTDQTRKYSYDTEKAQALFAEAGWTKNADGLLSNDKGEVLRFTFRTTSGNKSRELVQQAIQSGWAELGVQAQIKNETPRVLFGKTLPKMLYDGAAMYAWLSSPQNIPKTTLHSTQIPTSENGHSGQNYVGYNNKTMDGVIDNLEVVCDVDKRNALWKASQEIYAEDLPALPLYFRADSFILPQWLKGIKPTGHQFPSSLWSEYWIQDGKM